jgi:hypothetical protein
MTHIVSGYAARFAIQSHRWIRMRQIIQDMDSFIFHILLMLQQNGLKTNYTKGEWQMLSNDWTR